MPNYGIIDLGSNTIRLCVYRTLGEGKKIHRDDRGFRSLLNNKVVAGLSAYVVDGSFTDEGIKRTLNVLKGHHKRLKYFSCERTDVFATAVIRNCNNSHEVITQLQEKSGFSINLLTGAEEAHLGFIGATCEHPIERGTLIDIGGGSTELTRVTNNTDEKGISLGLGSLSEFTSCVSGVLPTQKELAEMEALLKKQLKQVRNKKAYHSPHFFGIGGSLRGAVKVLTAVYGEKITQAPLEHELFTDFFNRYRSDKNEIAHTILKVIPERIHTLIPGCLIASLLMEELGGQTLEVRRKGVREGYLIEKILSDV